MSLKKTGDEINRETLTIAKQLGFPHVYLYFDPKDSDSKVALDLMKYLSPFWSETFTFLYVA